VTQPLEAAQTLVGFRVELSRGGRSVELTARRANGAAEPLLWNRNYRDEWQAPYVMRQPVVLPAGSALQITAYFDESAPTPRRATVHFTAYESGPVSAAKPAPAHVH
jgi:hypothetical protein